MERLSVWFQGLRAGALDYDDRTNSFTFSYDYDYLARDDAAALVLGRFLSIRITNVRTRQRMNSSLS